MNAIEQLRTWIGGSDNIVFFGGAGVSTGGGIPDFRGEDGLYRQQYQYPPETIISRSFYMKDPEEFHRFYRNKMIFEDAKPNPIRLTLVRLEKQGRLKAVITQNIDSLHQAAGSREVLELHGSIHRDCCARYGELYGLDVATKPDGVLECSCDGTVKPDVVLYRGGLDQETLQKAVHYISHADMLIVGGTSLTVHPVAGLIDYYRGRKLMLISKTMIPIGSQADLVISDKLGEVPGSVVREL